MKTAIIPLEEIELPKGIKTLHGYWKPPGAVMQFWSTGATVRFINEAQYEHDKKIILASRRKCVDKLRGKIKK